MEKAQKLNDTNCKTHTHTHQNPSELVHINVYSMKGNDKDSNLLGHNAMQTGNQFLIL
jgi:hypothetical protein